MSAWLMDETHPPFDQEARYTRAIFTDMATKAVGHRLPMKLDTDLFARPSSPSRPPLGMPR